MQPQKLRAQVGLDEVHPVEQHLVLGLEVVLAKANDLPVIGNTDQ